MNPYDSVILFAAAQVTRALLDGAQSPSTASHFLSSATKSGAFTCWTPWPIKRLISAIPSQSMKQMFFRSMVSCSPSPNTDSADARSSSIHWPLNEPSNCRVNSRADSGFLRSSTFTYVSAFLTHSSWSEYTFSALTRSYVVLPLLFGRRSPLFAYRVQALFFYIWLFSGATKRAPGRNHSRLLGGALGKSHAKNQPSSQKINKQAQPSR